MAPPLRPSIACLLLATLTSAQIIDKLSFGKSGTIADPRGHGIPGWQASSVNHEVQVLSDRVILTPPVPGNAKGALWTESRADTQDWTAEIHFRASGQESGSGNLNIWYTNDRDQVGINSVYNAEKFDGLVLTVDQYGGSGGKIRGFLNDGTQNFRAHASLESLAFGHCDYPYRNRGEYSRLKISNTNGLTVSVDDRVCFSTSKMSLPQGYFFGVTATTGENPDSFELAKFLVTSGGGSPVTNQAFVGSMNQPNSHGQPHVKKMDSMPGAPGFVPDRDADSIKSQTEQFADLHNRIQNLQHDMANIFLEFKALSDRMENRQSELLASVQNMKGSKESGLPPEIVGKINRMSDKLESMDRTVEAIKKETTDRDYKQHLQELHMTMEKLHGGMTEGLPDHILDIVSRHTPRLGFFVFMIIAVQIMLAGGYVVYKRRRNGMPKKFL